MNNLTNNDFLTIFVFPFIYKNKKNTITPELASGELQKKGWTISYFSPQNSKENYNEFHYFHPHVRKVIFNMKNKENGKKKGMEYLVRNDFKELEVEFFNKKNELRKITTDINSIDMHLFDNQIGFLSITTQKNGSDKQTDFNSFLQYNDVARRVYPPYLGLKNTCTLKNDTKILPVRISLLKENDVITENFDAINLNAQQGKEILFLSKIVKQLLEPFVLKDSADMDNGKIYYAPYIDDRMFIVSYYSDKNLSDELKQESCDKYNYETSDDWYRFIFVDGNYINIKNKKMKNDLIIKHTYARWIEEYGTLYGMSRYSFVMLCNGEEPSLKQHMCPVSHYFN